MFQTKVVEEIKTHFLFSVTFLENRAIYEIMWKNTVERGRPQVAMWRMRIACWITQATHTHTLTVCSTALPLQQWLLITCLRVAFIRTLPVLLYSAKPCRPEWYPAQGQFYQTENRYLKEPPIRQD